MIEGDLTLSDLDGAIEVAIREIEIAPSLRDRARKNLRHLARTKGIAAVVEKIEHARGRKNRGRAWLGHEALSSNIDSITESITKVRAQDTNAQLWPVLVKIAKTQRNKEWAQLVDRAASNLRKIDEAFVREDIRLAEQACIDLIQASEVDDFKSETNIIKGAVFAETANLYTICAKVTREQTYIERGLFLYGLAVDTISRGNYPLALTVVQINRGTALTYYAHLIEEKTISKYANDIVDVIGFLDQNQRNTGAFEAKYSSLAENVKRDLHMVDSFSKEFSDRSNWSDLARCSLDFMFEDDHDQYLVTPT